MLVEHRIGVVEKRKCMVVELGNDVEKEEGLVAYWRSGAVERK